MRYLKGWFIVDLLATFPSDYIVKAIQVRMSADDSMFAQQQQSVASSCSDLHMIHFIASIFSCQNPQQQLYLSYIAIHDL
jgi:hypothetical protein